jgi:hypothetical protein
MKVLMLVISSDTYPVYAKHREVWKTYMKSHPEVECVFITYHPLVFVPTRTDDTLVLRGLERYGTIYGKTIEALEYFLTRRKYDYIVRTNLSSVWDFRRLREYLETQPRERVYAGQTGVNPDTGIAFASGAGILMSSDVARTLLANAHIGRSLNAFDDVAIAKALLVSGLSPSPLPRVDFISLAHYEEHHTKIPPESFHYRMKHTDYLGDRMEEPEMMRRLLREHIYAS